MQHFETAQPGILCLCPYHLDGTFIDVVALQLLSHKEQVNDH